MTPDIQFLSKLPIKGHGTTEMRCVQPARYLTDAGLSATVGCVYRDLPRASRAIVFHRVLDDAMTRRAMAMARAMGCKVIYDIDDLLFDPRGADHVAGVSGQAAAAGSDAVERYRRAMLASDLVLCSTGYLKDLVDGFHPSCAVMRNGASKALLDLAAGRSPSKAEGPVTLAYFSGSAHHDADFRIIAPALISLLDAVPSARLLLVGKLEFDPRLRDFGTRFEYRSFVPYTEFIGYLGDADINLAPLDQSDPFAQARSELKYIEAGAVGVPTVASPTQTFAGAIRDGENGVLCGDGDWFETLSRLVQDRALRARLGQAARDDVAAAYGPVARAQEWRALVDGLDAVPPRPGQPVAGPGAGLHQAMAVGYRRARRAVLNLR